MHDLEPPELSLKLIALRARCYEEVNDPLAKTAHDDLALVTSWHPRLGTLPPPPEGARDAARP